MASTSDWIFWSSQFFEGHFYFAIASSSRYTGSRT
jgi:hypothetical protein